MKNISNITEDEFELIEQFLNKKLPAEEMALFEARMITDEIWRQKTDEIRLLISGINEAVLQDRMDTYHNSIPNINKAFSQRGRVISLSKKWLAAASILLVVSLTVWMMTKRETSNEKLYSQYFRPDPGLITAMGSSEDYNFDKAMVEYKEGNYDKAIEAWLKLSTAAPQNDTLNYFLGVAYLAKNENEKAQDFLFKVVSDNANSFYNDGCWYLGLNFIKNNEPQKASEWIKRSGHTGSINLLNAINKK